MLASVQTVYICNIENVSPSAQTLLKAQVSFSDQNLSVVRRRRCRSCRRKLFTFLSHFSPEPLGRFQPNLAQSTPSVKGIHICSNDDPHLFPRGDNNEIAKIHLRHFLKIFLSRTTGSISSKLGVKHTWVKGIQVCSNE